MSHCSPIFLWEKMRADAGTSAEPTQKPKNLPTLIALALSTAVFPAPKNAELWEILSASKGGLLSGVRPLWTDAAHHLYCEHEFAVVVRKKESAPLTMER